MTETPNYGLNQWALTDPVRMSDFNEDNAKIDAAFKDMDDKRVRIQTGTYVGTGRAGEQYPNKITFDFEPLILLLFDEYGRICYYSVDSSGYSIAPAVGCPSQLTTEYHADALWNAYIPGTGGYSSITYAKKSTDGKTVFWYFTNYRQEEPKGQFNESGKTYRWVAIG